MIPKALRWLRSEHQLELTWNDGPKRLSAYALRCDCRCAACVDEQTGKRILNIAAVPNDIGLKDIARVGNYSLKLTFTDLHDTGLFTWEHLWELANPKSA